MTLRTAIFGFALLFGSIVNGDPIDFDTEIVPLLTKAGCNAASCHGSAAGQGGFRLSLFGGDADFDYRTIVRELGGRRVNHVDPSSSLLITKPTLQLDHGGQDVLQADGEPAEVLTRWVTEGAKRLRLRRVIGLRVEPNEFVASSAPVEFALRVTASFDDGIERDVTTEAVYTSQNESAISVSSEGQVRILEPGRHTAIVRFAGEVLAVTGVTPIGKDPIEFAESSRNNWIDDEVNDTLLALRLPPAGPADDATFLRRVTLDLTGRLPSATVVLGFLADEDPNKRAKVVDRMLGSTEFTEYWTHWLGSQLRLRKPAQDAASLESFYDWLRERVEQDTGWNEIARTLVTAEGDCYEFGPATVHRFFPTAREEAEYMTEVLMGVRLRCANCHNHPLDRWTQDDYHGLAAIFAGFERGKVVKFTGRGSVVHPRTGKDALARIPGERFLASGNNDVKADHRTPLVEWLTAEDNQYFAKAMVGRIWEQLMGRGLVSPVDDLRATNPPTHPQLLDRLAAYFRENGYQLRPLIELICNSATYQRSSSRTGDQPPDDRFYSYAIAKQLSAEVLADAIGDVTGVANDFEGVGRAINVVDRSKTHSKLQYLGQCEIGEACTTNTSASQRGIASQLHFMNGELLNRKLQDERSHLQELLKNKASTQEIVEGFYLRALGRRPTEAELSLWLRRIEGVPGGEADDKRERCEDFVWALLNCREFKTNP